MIKARLANRPDEDICLLLQPQNHKLNYLCDCGTASQMSVKERRDVAAIFISHTHVDHFTGFDEIMRHQLAIGRGVVVCGPPGLAENVSCKMRAFTWNLGYDDKALFYEVREIQPDGSIVVSELRVPDWLPRRVRVIEDAEGVVYENEAFTTRYALLSHGNIPSVAYLFEAPTRTKVRAGELGYRPGPWVRRLLDAYEAGDPEQRIDVHGEALRAGDLFEHVYENPGQRIGFVMDHLGSEENHALIEALCAGADQLFIEAYYRDEDREMALINNHSTVKLSVILLTLFSFFPRLKAFWPDLSKEPDNPNIYYIGDIRQCSISSFYHAVEPLTVTDSIQYDKMLIKQIIITAQIAYAKFTLFSWAVICFLIGVLLFLCAAVT